MCEHQNLRYQWNSLALQTARLRWCGDVIWYTIQSFQSRPFIDHFHWVARQRLCESYTESITPSHRENLVSSITAWQTSPGSAHCSLPSLATHTCILPINTNFSSPTRLPRRLVHGRSAHWARHLTALPSLAALWPRSPSTSSDNPWKLIFSTIILIDCIIWHLLVFCSLRFHHRTHFHDSFCLASMF